MLSNSMSGQLTLHREFVTSISDFDFLHTVHSLAGIVLKMAPKSIFLLFAFIASCLAGKLTISYAPDSLRFSETTSALRSSSLDDLLAAALGYTPKETISWSGLTITSPFASPSALVLIGIGCSGSDMLQEGTRYNLQEDQSLLKVFSSLKALVGARAQRPTHFQHVEVADIADEVSSQMLSENSSLQTTRQPDAVFLLEVNALPQLAAKLKVNSTVSHGGQDFIFYQLESFSLLVKTYGDDSPQVREGRHLLRDGIGRLIDDVRELYDDNVLVVSAMIENPVNTISRKTRSVLQSEFTQTVDLRLSSEYSEDYPAIFNIILIMSLVLAITVLAVSMSMAYMDPGRDSIIYRMSNPRMKKDQ